MLVQPVHAETVTKASNAIFSHTTVEMSTHATVTPRIAGKMYPYGEADKETL